MKPTISAVIITRNEAEMLPGLLESLHFCDEIVVVDSHSDDATRDIAASFKAKVIVRDFNGFGDQKEFARTQAGCDWVLSLDADERVPAVLAGESITLEDQLAQWEQRKSLEKLARESIMDDIPTAQPALALAQKVLARAETAGLPADLIPESITTVTVSADVDAESALRSAVLEFMSDVRAAEQAVAESRRGAEVAAELDDAPLEVIGEDEWRAHWPGAATESGAAESQGAESQAAED